MGFESFIKLCLSICFCRRSILSHLARIKWLDGLPVYLPTRLPASMSAPLMHSSSLPESSTRPVKPIAEASELVARFGGVALEGGLKGGERSSKI